MKNKLNHLLLLFSALAACLAGCSKKQDAVFDVADSDPAMLAAIAKARDTLPMFWEVFEQRANGATNFSLKVKITDKHGAEHFWLSDIERKEGKMYGTIANDADVVKSVKLGDRITFPEADISDWYYLKDNKMVGNYTLRVLFKQMPADEVAKYKKILADP